MRDIAKKTAQKTSLPEDWAVYRAKRNQTNLEVKRTKKEFIQKTLANNTGNSRETWKVLNA